MPRIKPKRFVHVVYRTRRFDAKVQYRNPALGIRPCRCIHDGITVSMYYGNPDGNQLEFQVDCFESNDAANSDMHGPHFSANPTGVEYDPEG